MVKILLAEDDFELNEIISSTLTKYGCSELSLPILQPEKIWQESGRLDRYVEDGLKETGAVNSVAGMILDYRAFDTLGESFVLFSSISLAFSSCIITEYIVKPKPQPSWFPKRGMVYFQKSFTRTLSLRSTYFKRIFTLPGINIIIIAHTVSTNFDNTVAMAAPATPSSGKGPIPKISKALKTMFTTTDTELISAHIPAFSQFFIIVRYTCEIARRR